MRSRRRTIGQGIALLALGAGVWLVVTAGDSSMMGGEIGSDDVLSTERVALARILDAVVAQVEVEAIDASGDQGAEFGAGAGPSGRPPAAPSLIGRHDPTRDGSDLGSGPVGPSGPSADRGRFVPAASSSTTGQPATTRPPTSTATTGSSTVTTAATRASTTSTGPSTTAPPTVTTRPVTTGVVTTGAVTTASTTATTAAPTTQPESSCLVIVSKVTKYRADHSGGSPVIGQATPGTYNVLERHGAKWYRVAGGWLRDNKKVTPSGC